MIIHINEVITLDSGMCESTFLFVLQDGPLMLWSLSGKVFINLKKGRIIKKDVLSFLMT